MITLRRPTDSSRLSCWSLVIAFVATALVVGPTSVRAESTFGIVDGPDSFLLDSSDDGRYVLTTAQAGPSVVVDVVAGRRIALPLEAWGTSRMSGDGQLVFLSTQAQLTSDDTDAADDVYSYAWSTGTFRLVSPGWPLWTFRLAPNAGWGGEADHIGNVAFTGQGPSTGLVPVFSDGSTVTRIGLSVNQPVGGGAKDISGDGRFVLFTVGPNLFVEDRQTSTAVQVNVGAVAARPVLEMQLSADGHHVAMVTDSPKVAYVHHLDSAQTVTIGAFATVNTPLGAVGLSADGSVVSVLRDTPTDTPSGVMQLPGVFLWREGTFTEVSAPAGGRPNGKADRGFVLPDGDTVVFDSEADNLVAGVTPPYNVYIRRSAGLPPAPPPVWEEASAYTARTPLRILDTRPHGPAVNHSGAIPPQNSGIRIPVAGTHGVPANATAVAVQVTATEGTGIGFVALRSGGSLAPPTSNLNIDVVSETIANMAVVPVGADGSIDLFTSLSTHLIVDLIGWWTPTPGAVASGRYNAVAPARVLDTRPETHVGGVVGKPGPASTAVVQMTGHGGVPATGVSAVAVNITVDGTTAPGFVQAAAGNGLVPGASSTLNVQAAGRVVAASTIVPVDENGQIALYSQSSNHLIVDVTGWFTDSTASLSTSGRFVPATSVIRSFDTRPGSAVAWAGPKPTPSTTLVMPSSTSTLVGNLTITDTDGPGFVQLGSAGTLTPGATSAINASAAAETIANGFISPASGGLGIYTIIGTHVIIDVSGYMTG